MALVSWVAPGSGSEAHRRRPAGLTSTCRLRPVRLCLPDHRSVRSFQLQHGRSVPSIMCTPTWGTSSTVASTGPKTLEMIRVTTEIAREIVGCDTPMISAIASWEVLVRKYINVARTAASGPRILGAKEISVSPSTISTRQLNCVLSRPVIPLPMTARS